MRCREPVSPTHTARTSETRPADQTENARSLGYLITFGKLKILDLGDLTWDKEMQLMCPVNKLGKVDILVVSHHGLFQSSSPALVDAIEPRVAIMNNGAKKGGSTPTFETLAKTPGSRRSGSFISLTRPAEQNGAEEYIANHDGTDAANYLKLTASPAASFTVFNSRTGRPRTTPGAEWVGGSLGIFSMRPSRKMYAEIPIIKVDAGYPKGPAEGVSRGNQIARDDGRQNPRDLAGEILDAPQGAYAACGSDQGWDRPAYGGGCRETGERQTDP